MRKEEERRKGKRDSRGGRKEGEQKSEGEGRKRRGMREEVQ